MTDLTTLYTLRDRLAAATGGYGDLDYEIRLALVPRDERTGDDIPFSSSIDAALALVERRLPGWDWMVCRALPNHLGTVAPPNDGGGTFDRYAPTTPLAILRALVEALIAQKETDHEA